MIGAEFLKNPAETSAYDYIERMEIRIEIKWIRSFANAEE